MVLDVFDVSSFVHTGCCAAQFKDRCYYNYPVGGIHYLMRYVTTSLRANRHVILCFDDRRNFRKEIMPCYKQGRIPNKTVISQLETLYEELSACGFSCYKAPGCEGDDIISWACTQNMNKYEEVVIYGNDRDLLHNVRDNVRFRSISKNVNSVCVGNFALGVSAGEEIPFNTISINKVLCGCNSDEVPAFVSQSGIKGRQLYNTYLKAIDKLDISFIQLYAYTTSKALFRKFYGQINALTPEDVEELERRIKVIFPADCPNMSVTPDTRANINMDLFAYFLSKYRDTVSLNMMQLPKLTVREEDIQSLRQKAYNLANGAVAVDNAVPVHNLDLLGESLFLKAFDEE